jgi:antibiotic biosynthesis monooxygenase (ABM) superfamily enzyme
MSDRSEVVSVIRHHVRPGGEEAYEAWSKDVLPIAQAFPGHQGVTIIRPPAGSRVYTVVLHFDTLDHLRAWLESATRRQLIERIEPHLASDVEIEIRPGLEVWMPPPGQAPARPYKQFLVVWSVIYPLQLVMPLLVIQLLPGAPLWIRSLIGTGLVVGMMTWVIMPRYTRAVSRWLYR